MQFIKKNHSILLFLALVLASCSIRGPVKNSNSYFKNKDTVCFIGNSITHGGYYFQFYKLYYLTRFPEKNVAFINCGLSGDVARNAYHNRLNEDILALNPDHAFLMFGMNDIKRHFYGDINATPQVIKERKAAIDTCKKYFKLMVKELKAHYVEPILVSPTIYEENMELEEKNLYLCNEALGKIAVFIKEYGWENNMNAVDIYSLMDSINQKMQEKKPEFTLIGPDRIHPGKDGHFVMFYAILKELEKPGFISYAHIDAEKRKVKQVKNCQVSDIHGKPGAFHFTYQPFSLPFPKYYHLKGKEYIPFSEEYNQEILKLSRLPEVNYRLLISNHLIDTFPSSALERGINLAAFHNTPQYKLAMEIARLNDSIHRCVAKNIRNKAFVEYEMAPEVTKTTNREAIKKILGEKISIHEGKSYYGYFKKQMETYLINLSRDSEIKHKLNSWKKELKGLRTKQISMQVKLEKVH